MTGIENSDPVTVAGRRDQLREAFDFYNNYERRLQNISKLGIKWLRFGPPYSQSHLGMERYDFTLTDKVAVLAELLDMKIIADLLHFGLPDWLHEQHPNERYFQNPVFPERFADYAEAFARRYRHVRHFTCVNEPYISANFSAKLGMWNEQGAHQWQDDRTFVKAVCNIAKAAILAKERIKRVFREEGRGEPVFVQNESFEVAFALPGSGRQAEAERFNLRRFAPLDLIFGHADPQIREYLISQGMKSEDYDWFMEHGNSRGTVLGIDHYPMCVHRWTADGELPASEEPQYELYSLTKIYWKRYPLPLLHTEVNAWPDHAITLCQQTYDIILRLRQEGYPVLGMGWYGDEYQVGWHSAMCGPQGFEETPVGLHYKGDPQPVALHFKKLASRGFRTLPILRFGGLRWEAVRYLLSGQMRLPQRIIRPLLATFRNLARQGFPPFKF